VSWARYEPGDADTVGAAPPHFIALSPGSIARSGRALHVEAPLRRLPGDAGTELSRRRLQRARELDDRAQARLATGSLEQRDLGPVQLAAVAELFLGDARFDAGLAEVCGEALLRSHRRRFLRVPTRTLQTERFPFPVRRLVPLPCSRGWRVDIRIFTQNALSAGKLCVIPVRMARRSHD